MGFRTYFFLFPCDNAAFLGFWVRLIFGLTLKRDINWTWSTWWPDSKRGELTNTHSDYSPTKEDLNEHHGTLSTNMVNMAVQTLMNNILGAYWTNKLQTLPSRGWHQHGFVWKEGDIWHHFQTGPRSFPINQPNITKPSIYPWISGLPPSPISPYQSLFQATLTSASKVGGSSLARPCRRQHSVKVASSWSDFPVFQWFRTHNIYIYMYVCMYIRMYVCMNVCMYVCMYVWMYIVYCILLILYIYTYGNIPCIIGMHPKLLEVIFRVVSGW
jgi:hypothetical protein